MKLACTTESFHRSLQEGRGDLLDLIELFHELKLEGIEIDSRQIADRSTHGLNRIKHACIVRGLTITNVCAFTNFGHRDARPLRQELDHVQSTIDVAVGLGAPIVRVFVGHPEENRQLQWPSMIETLGKATEMAQSAGVILGMENHNHGGFAQTADDVERIMSEVGSDWLKLILDTANYADGMRSIERTVCHVVHVHLKCFELDDKGKEIGDDEHTTSSDLMKVILLSGNEKQYVTDLGLVLDQLNDHNYLGFMSVEYEGQEPDRTAVPRAVGHIRQLLRERI